jgi:hypothetical protein
VTRTCTLRPAEQSTFVQGGRASAGGVHPPRHPPRLRHFGSALMAAHPRQRTCSGLVSNSAASRHGTSARFRAASGRVLLQPGKLPAVDQSTFTPPGVLAFKASRRPPLLPWRAKRPGAPLRRRQKRPRICAAPWQSRSRAADPAGPGGRSDGWSPSRRGAGQPETTSLLSRTSPVTSPSTSRWTEIRSHLENVSSHLPLTWPSPRIALTPAPEFQHTRQYRECLLGTRAGVAAGAGWLRSRAIACHCQSPRTIWNGNMTGFVNSSLDWRGGYDAEYRVDG